MFYFIEQKTNPNTTVWKALLQVPGLSVSSATYICARFGLSKNFLVKDLTDEEIKGIQKLASKNFLINKAMRTALASGFTAHYISRARRGMRLRQGLPVRGQRTRSNSKTAVRLRGYWLSERVIALRARNRGRRWKKQKRTAAIQKITRLNRLARGLPPLRNRTKKRR